MILYNKYCNFKIYPIKKLGQHFIKDIFCIYTMIKLIKNKTFIIEIGPGIGSMTNFILKICPDNFVIVEIDLFLIKILKYLNNYNTNNCYIIHGDALQIEEEKIFKKKFTIIANLPYNISIPLILKWLQKVYHIYKIIIMLQKEVADKLIAKKSTKKYGSLTIIIQRQFFCKKIIDISPKYFIPQPKIYSSIIELLPRKNIYCSLILNKYKIICNIFFFYRRKKIIKIINKYFLNYKNKFKLIDIDLNSRPEDLSVYNFTQILYILDNIYY